MFSMRRQACVQSRMLQVVDMKGCSQSARCGLSLDYSFWPFLLSFLLLPFALPSPSHSCLTIKVMWLSVSCSDSKLNVCWCPLPLCPCCPLSEAPRVLEMEHIFPLWCHKAARLQLLHALQLCVHWHFQTVALTLPTPKHSYFTFQK